MSNIKIKDQRGGVYEAVIEFTYGECERLPYNLLRKVKARIEPVPDGGVNATAKFNIRSRQESAAFLELLDLFGEDGSFVHGSPADPAALSLVSPPTVKKAESADADDDELEIEEDADQK